MFAKINLSKGGSLSTGEQRFILPALTQVDKIVGIGIFLYWQIYENVIFLYPENFGGVTFLGLVYFFKLAFPFLLFVYASFNGLVIPKPPEVKIYVLLFLAFLIWSVVPTIIGGDLINWVKLLPLIFFFCSALSIFIKRPQIIVFLIKLIIAISVFSLLQYMGVMITGIYESRVPGSISLTGPLGLFGVTSGNFYLPGIDNPIIRLGGFWKEPSNASGVNFACFFLARYLYKIENKTKWYYISFISLTAGFLSLSNAGYLALACGGLVSVVLNFKQFSVGQKSISIAFFMPILIGLLWMAMFSRSYLASTQSENNFLLAVAGVRVNSYDDPNYDPSSGRLELLESVFQGGIKNIIGEGVQQVGDKTKLVVPASAPFFWLTLTGYIGFVLIILREIFVFFGTLRLNRIYPTSIYIVQAYIVVLVQQSIYGVWMDPNYLIMVAFVFSLLSIKSKEIINYSSSDSN
jgi:hypothetical protein